MSLQVTFLGTSGAVPTPQRNPSGVSVTREGEQFLFDAGEGTQRQMMRFGTGFAVSDIFVTHRHGDHVLGIPGLLLTMGSNDRTEPLTIHVPRGTEEEIEALVTLLDRPPAFPVEIDPVDPDTVALSRHEFEIRSFATDHDTRSVGYALVEDERKGRFDREAAERLGVPAGPLFSRLHEGESVELEDGTIVNPEQVVGEPRSGRTIVYTGDTRPTDATAEVADQPDLLIHDGTFREDCHDRARETAHSTARQAGSIAAKAGARRLALVHLSTRYGERYDDHRAEAIDGLESAGGLDCAVIVPEDGQTLDIPFPDA